MTLCAGALTARADSPRREQSLLASPKTTLSAPRLARRPRSYDVLCGNHRFAAGRCPGGARRARRRGGGSAPAAPRWADKQSPYYGHFKPPGARVHGTICPTTRVWMMYRAEKDWQWVLGQTSLGLSLSAAA